jgi:hypothetical protein
MIGVILHSLVSLWQLGEVGILVWVGGVCVCVHVNVSVSVSVSVRSGDQVRGVA